MSAAGVGRILWPPGKILVTRAGFGVRRTSNVFSEGGEIMYILAESAVLVMIACVLGGLSFATVATLLIVKEGLDGATRALRRR